jgi:hypothetical protein
VNNRFLARRQQFSIVIACLRVRRKWAGIIELAYKINVPCCTVDLYLLRDSAFRKLLTIYGSFVSAFMARNVDKLKVIAMSFL